MTLGLRHELVKDFTAVWGPARKEVDTWFPRPLAGRDRTSRLYQLRRRWEGNPHPGGGV